MTALPWTDYQHQLRYISQEAPRNEQGAREGPHLDVAVCAKEVEYAVRS